MFSHSRFCGASRIYLSDETVIAETIAPILTKFYSTIEISKYTSWLAHRERSLLSTTTLLLLCLTCSPFSSRQLYILVARLFDLLPKIEHCREDENSLELLLSTCRFNTCCWCEPDLRSFDILTSETCRCNRTARLQTLLPVRKPRCILVVPAA